MDTQPNIQLEQQAKNNLTEIVNKVFVMSPVGKAVRDTIDKHVLGGNDPNNPRPTGERAFRDIYPIQSGPDVQIVDKFVSDLYSIYLDIAKFINDTDHKPTGVLLTPDPSLEEAIKSFVSTLTSEANSSFKVDIVNGNQFSSWCRDALVASIIRGYRIHFIATDPDISGGNLSSLFGGENRLKYIDSPLEVFSADNYDKAEVKNGSAKTIHLRRNYPHDNDPKIPYNELAPQTLAIFLKKNSTFASVIRKNYGIDQDHIMRTYPSDKYPLEEAFTKGAGDMDLSNEKTMPAMDYVFYFMKRFIRTLLLNEVDATSFKSLFRQADSLLSAGGDSEDKEVRVGAEQNLDFLGKASEDDSQYDELLKSEEGRTENPDILPKKVASEFGGEDRHLMTILCNEVLRELCQTKDGFADNFDFHAIESRTGVGVLTIKNLYYGFIRPMFDYYEHSQEGILLIYHFYNSIGKDNIGMSVQELEQLKAHLPKTLNEIKIFATPTPDLISKIDKIETDNEAVTVACEVTNRVFADGIGAQLFNSVSDESSYLVEPLKRLLNPQTFQVTSEFLADLTKTWQIVTRGGKQATASEDSDQIDDFIDDSTEAPASEVLPEGRKQAPKAAGSGMTRSQAITVYFDSVKSIFDELDPEIGYSKSERSNGSRNDFVYLYPTDTNRQFTKFGADIFPNREAYINAYHGLLNKLTSLRVELENSDEMITIANLLTEAFTSSFPNPLFWKLTAGTAAKGAQSTVGKLVLPAVRSEDGGIKELKDLTSRNLSLNVSNILIKNLLTSISKTAAGEETQSNVMGGVPLESKKLTTKNTKLAVIALLHCRMEFLIAVKKLSDDIVSIFKLYRPTVEQIQEKDRKLLSDYDNLHTERVQNLLKSIVSNVSFNKQKFADEGITGNPEQNVETHPEIEDVENVAVNSPDFDAYATARRQKLQREKERAERAQKFKNLELDEL